MPYLHLDLPGTYPMEVKRELARRLCKLYAEVMETQPWRAAWLPVLLCRP
jgi:phenylpyruvate tautomerase PptA (4-oxalocrotonate tautomerase family)